MKNSITAIFTVALSTIVLTVTLSNQSFAAAPPVIYGEDNRKDLYDVLNPMLVKLADSTVALIKTDSLTQSSGVVQIKATTLRQSMNVCEKEPFANQPNAAFCSGFLVKKNILLTAGHCITDQMDCNETSFVFGYSVKEAGKFPTSAPSSEVYSCKRIIKRDQIGTGPDYAVIELDRAVPNHEPLALNRSRMNSTIEKGTKLVMIGHPSGLPTKVDDGASVRDGNKDGFFVATTDSYGGNSGSAVFNLNNGEVEGILVRGERDFVYGPNGCIVSNVCSENGCRGEDVTKISAAMPYIPAN